MGCEDESDDNTTRDVEEGLSIEDSGEEQFCVAGGVCMTAGEINILLC
jgi:hypothetical protein